MDESVLSAGCVYTPDKDYMMEPEDVDDVVSPTLVAEQREARIRALQHQDGRSVRTPTEAFAHNEDHQDAEDLYRWYQTLLSLAEEGNDFRAATILKRGCVDLYIAMIDAGALVRERWEDAVTQEVRLPTFIGTGDFCEPGWCGEPVELDYPHDLYVPYYPTVHDWHRSWAGEDTQDTSDAVQANSHYRKIYLPHRSGVC
jgi:hypothetical protein